VALGAESWERWEGILEILEVRSHVPHAPPSRAQGGTVGGVTFPSRLLVRAAAVLVVLAIAWVAVTAVRVVVASRAQDRGSAQAIIVLGAAQYNGRPSAVFSARLDHAAELYADGAADVVAVTGGSQPGDRTTEAAVAADYLFALGVPHEQILRVTDGTNTWESLAATARVLRAEGLTDVVLVSDPFHSLRSESIAAEVGLDAHSSPTRDSPIRGLAEVRQMARETLAVALGDVIGYRRLVRLADMVRA